jgi:hypothetical protein
MCLQVVERYAVCKYVLTCMSFTHMETMPRTSTLSAGAPRLTLATSRCLYHKHAVDACGSWGQKGHVVTEKTVYVGYTCPNHSSQQTQSTYPHSKLSDSGYASGSFR